MIEKFIQTLPKTIFACQYGSSLHAPNDSSKMIDLLIIAESSRQFHTENLKKNPDHYSFMCRKMGPSYIFNKSIFTGVLYNPFIKFEDRLFKYGIANIKTLESDILNQDTYFLAGRLMKPVKTLQSCKEVSQLLDRNYQTAVFLQCRYLYLRYYSKVKLLASLSSISKSVFFLIKVFNYSGDFRTKYFEDNKKIDRIVESQFKEFQQIYQPIIIKFFKLNEQNQIELKELNQEQINLLPQRFKQVYQKYTGDVQQRPNYLLDYIKELNYVSSLNQIMTSLYTTSLTKQVCLILLQLKYITAKFQKASAKQ